MTLTCNSINDFDISSFLLTSMKYIFLTLLLWAFFTPNLIYAGVPMIDSEATLEDIYADKPVTPLMSAAYHGNIQKMEKIIKNGTDVNEKSTWGGETALMYASRNGKKSAVELLLQNKADPDITTTSGGNTALIFASYFADPDIVHLLLKKGADPNIIPNTRDMLGNAPALVMAIEAGKIENVRLLLEYGAKLRNSLASAVGYNRIDIVNLLVEKGASVRRNIPTLVYTKKIAKPEIKQLLDLDTYQLLGKEDAIYPDSLDELAGEGTYAVARKIYLYPNFVLGKTPEIALVENSFTYLETKVIKNAIFARYGYAFDTIWLRNYFVKNFDTYSPKTKNITLSPIDKKNLAYIKYLEKMCNNRK